MSMYFKGAQSRTQKADTHTSHFKSNLTKSRERKFTGKWLVCSGDIFSETGLQLLQAAARAVAVRKRRIAKAKLKARRAAAATVITVRSRNPDPPVSIS